MIGMLFEEPFWWPALKEVLQPALSVLFLGVAGYLVTRLRKDRADTRTSLDLAAAASADAAELGGKNNEILHEVRKTVNGRTDELQRLNAKLQAQLRALGVEPDTT